LIAIKFDHSEGFVANGPVKEAENFGAELILFSDSDLLNGTLEATVQDRILARIEASISREFRHHP
jgi:hypothetical protein